MQTKCIIKHRHHWSCSSMPHTTIMFQRTPIIAHNKGSSSIRWVFISKHEAAHFLSTMAMTSRSFYALSGITFTVSISSSLRTSHCRSLSNKLSSTGPDTRLTNSVLTERSLSVEPVWLVSAWGLPTNTEPVSLRKMKTYSHVCNTYSPVWEWWLDGFTDSLLKYKRHVLEVCNPAGFHPSPLNEVGYRPGAEGVPGKQWHESDLDTPCWQTNFKVLPGRHTSPVHTFVHTSLSSPLFRSLSSIPFVSASSNTWRGWMVVWTVVAVI